jgi:hypothetical protein
VVNMRDEVRYTGMLTKQSSRSGFFGLVVTLPSFGAGGHGWSPLSACVVSHSLSCYTGGSSDSFFNLDLFGVGGPWIDSPMWR